MIGSGLIEDGLLDGAVVIENSHDREGRDVQSRACALGDGQAVGAASNSQEGQAEHRARGGQHNVGWRLREGYNRVQQALPGVLRRSS